MDARRSETWFFVALLALTVFLTWLVLAPYLAMLIFAGTLAFLFQPLYQRLLRIFRYEWISALATIVIVTLIVFVPLGFFGVKVFGEATGIYSSLTSPGGFDLGVAITNFAHAHFPNLVAPNFSFNVADYARQGLTWLIQNLGSFFSGIAQTFFTVFLSLLAIFYFLKDGERLKKWTVETVPLAPQYSEDILREMEAAGSSVVRGTLVVALVMGLVIGFGFFLFGIPDPTFWGALVVIASIIPIVGTWLVVVPAIGYLLLTGQTVLGVCLIVWSIIFVNVIYSVLSPQLMRRGVNLHPYLILLGVLGGIGAFGPVGFLIGPLVLALLFSLLKIYAKLTVGEVKGKV